MKLFFKIFDKVEEIGMALGMAIMVIVNFANVVSRYLMPTSPLSFTEELTVLLFVWVTMLGVSCGYKRMSHTGLSIITDMLPKKGQKVFIVISTAATAALMIVLIILGGQMVASQIKYGQIMTALKIPEAVAGLSIPVGAAMILIRAIQAGISNFVNYDKNLAEKVAREAEAAANLEAIKEGGKA